VSLKTGRSGPFFSFTKKIKNVFTFFISKVISCHLFPLVYVISSQDVEKVLKDIEHEHEKFHRNGKTNWRVTVSLWLHLITADGN